ILMLGTTRRRPAMAKNNRMSPPGVCIWATHSSRCTAKRARRAQRRPGWRAPCQVFQVVARNGAAGYTGHVITSLDRDIAMAIDTQPLELKLVRAADGQEVDLLPLQGLWTVEQYLKLTDQTNQLIEFTDGVIEVLPMPTDKHQAISRLLFLALLTFVQR